MRTAFICARSAARTKQRNRARGSEKFGFHSNIRFNILLILFLPAAPINFGKDKAFIVLYYSIYNDTAVGKIYSTIEELQYTLKFLLKFGNLKLSLV